MKILGLTGSIGMGKSTAAEDFRRLGVPVFDADAAAHELLGPGGDGVDPVADAFPGVLIDTADGPAIDRNLLGAAVFGDDAAMGRLECILHPKIRVRENRFLSDAVARGDDLVVLDIPLLFETDGAGRCDAVAVVSAPAAVQRERVMARDGMNETKFTAILDRQTPDKEKRARADFIIETGNGFDASFRAIADIVKAMRG